MKERLQEVLDELGKWAKGGRWTLVQLNVLHFDKLNYGRTYTVNGRALESIVEQMGSEYMHIIPCMCDTGRQSGKGGIWQLAFIGLSIEYSNWGIMLQLLFSFISVRSTEQTRAIGLGKVGSAYPTKTKWPSTQNITPLQNIVWGAEYFHFRFAEYLHLKVRCF